MGEAEEESVFGRLRELEKLLQKGLEHRERGVTRKGECEG